MNISEIILILILLLSSAGTAIALQFLDKRK